MIRAIAFAASAICMGLGAVGSAVGIGITVQIRATKASNYHGAQSYLYEHDETAEVEVCTRRRDGVYRLRGRTNYGTCYIGERREYTDPCF